MSRAWKHPQAQEGFCACGCGEELKLSRRGKQYRFAKGHHLRNPLIDGKRCCTTCGEAKTLDQFHKSAQSRVGVISQCKECRRARNKASRRKRTIESYGISLADYDSLFKSQNGRCWICGSSSSRDGRPLHIDHCHENGNIRGLLCGACNVGLGSFDDNAERLAKAIEYLRRGEKNG